MPNGDPRDGFFYPTLTIMIDSYIIIHWSSVTHQYIYVYEITVTLDFIFRLMLCSREDVSFNIICLNTLEGIKQLYLLMLSPAGKGLTSLLWFVVSNCEKHFPLVSRWGVLDCCIDS